MQSVLLAGCLTLWAGAAQAGEIRICAQHSDAEDWAALFEKGPIVVPAYTVFTFGGPVFNGLQDPKDDAHWPADKNSWIGISAAEEKRRDDLISQDMEPGPRDHVALVTLSAVTLTKRAPCSSSAAESAMSDGWGWTQSEVPSDPSVFYQVYGVIASDSLSTAFDDDSDQFQFAVTRGEINASVIRTVERTYSVPPGQ